MYVGLHVKYQLCLSDFNEMRIFPTYFRKKTLNIKFRGNLSNGSRVVPCGQTEVTKFMWFPEILWTRLKIPLFQSHDFVSCIQQENQSILAFEVLSPFICVISYSDAFSRLYSTAVQLFYILFFPAFVHHFKDLSKLFAL